MAKLGKKGAIIMMVRQSEEEKKRLFQELKLEFGATFGELIPGIIHALANPLNGILGRSELLEGRARHTLEPIVLHGGTPDDVVREDCRKIIHDVRLITEEANRLFDLFNNVAGKFRAMEEDIARRGINLSEVMKEEVTFLQFYPDSRHGIEKRLRLDSEIPEVGGVKAHYAVSFAAILRYAIHSMEESEVKELLVETGHDGSHVRVTIKYSGVPLTYAQREAMLVGAEGGHQPPGNNMLFCALSLLKQSGALLQIGRESGYNSMSFRIPCRAVNEKG